MFPIRPENISNHSDLTLIFYKIKEYNIAAIKFYKDIVEIELRLPTEKLTFNEFKTILNTLNLKCSSRVITIFKLLIPNTTRINFNYERFLKITKIFRNIKLSSFNEPVTKKDRDDINEIFNFIPQKSYIDYKLIRFSKPSKNRKTCQFLLSDNVRDIDLTDNVILYLKSFTTLDNIINISKLKALTHL